MKIMVRNLAILGDLKFWSRLTLGSAGADPRFFLGGVHL